MATKSPSSRALDECRKRGWTVQAVEYGLYVPVRPARFAKVPGRPRPVLLFYMMKRRDLYGIGDLLALDGEPGSHMIQVTSGSCHSARVKKAYAEPRLQEWLRSGNRFSVWSFRRNSKNRWVHREDPMTLERWEENQ